MEEKISRSRRKALLKRMKSLIGVHQKDIHLAAFFAWIQFLMRIISFGYIAKIFESLITGKKESILLFIVVIVSLNVIGYVIALFAKKYQGVASQHARNHLKNQFIQAFEKNRDNFTTSSSTDILNVASQGIDMLDTYYSLYMSLTYRTYFNCATVLVLVTIMYPLAAIVFIISLPFIPVFIILIQKRSKKIMNHYWGTYMDVGNTFMDNLDGLNTLYSYQQDELYEKNFADKAEEFRLSTMELLRFQLQSVGYMDGVMYLGIAISGFLAAIAFRNHELSVFSVIFFLFIAAEFFAPIREMGYGMHLVMMNTKMADRIFKFLDSVEMVEEKDEVQLSNISKINIKNLSFKYDKNNVIENLSIEFTPSKIYAISAISGRGKTTLAKILMKKLLTYEGEIWLDNHELNSISSEEIYRHVHYISSENYLFNLSIMENLKLSNSLSEDEIKQWIEKEKLLKFVGELPNGLDTVVGENGNLISPGQRQQILCARSLLQRKSVYIFDEMTSSVDSENELEIFNMIKNTTKDAIVLFISHKMKQVLNCDEVLFMDDCFYFDTPQNLLNQNKNFRDIVETQNKLEEIYNEK